jgi:hypothetical protein
METIYGCQGTDEGQAPLTSLLYSWRWEGPAGLQARAAQRL